MKRSSGLNPSLKQEALAKLLNQCPHCQASRDQLKTSVINQSNKAELVHIRCQTCQGAVVALLFSTGPLISSIGLITDLNAQDVIRFQRAEALSEDNLFALHQWLHQPKAVADLLQ